MPRTAIPNLRTPSPTGRYRCEWCGQRFDWANEGKRNGGKTPRFCSDGCQVMELVECAGCGEVVAKRKSRAGSRRPTCSLMCRYFVQYGRWQSSRLTSRALVPWSPPLIAPPRPKPLPQRRPSRFVSCSCDECGESFIGDRGAMWSRQEATFCSPRCAGRVSRRTRRAREHNAPGEFKWLDVVRLHLANDRRCSYCTRPMTEQPDPDHVIPLSRGGYNDLSNILPSCRQCNTDKRDLTPDEWMVDRERRGLSPITFDATRWRHLVLRPATRVSSERAAA